MALTIRTGALVVAGMLTAACGLSLSGSGTVAEEPDDGGKDEANAAAAAAGASIRTDGGSITDAASDGAMDVAPEDSATGDASTVDAPTDDAATADAGDAGTPVFAVVQQGHGTKSNTTTTSVSVSPTSTGNFIAVLATYYGVTPTISGVVDNAPGGSSAYVSANVRSVVGTCQAAEIWYAREARPGATSVTVTASGNVTFGVWVLEVSGMSTTGGVDVSAFTSGGPSTTITGPAVTPSGAPALVVSAVGSCGTVGAIAAGNPFIALPPQNGNDAAYYVANAVGTWGPVFKNSNDKWNASVAAFR